MELENILGAMDIDSQTLDQSDYLNVHGDSAYEMYCGHNGMPYDCLMCMNLKSRQNSQFFPTSTGYGITYPSLLEPKIEGSLHDTFKTDRYGNSYDGHSTLGFGNKRKTILNFNDF